MFSSLAALATLLTLSSAQTSVVDIYLPHTALDNFRASIAGSDATATTFVLACAPEANPTACPVSAAADTITAGPETLHYSAAINDATFTVDCSLRGTTTGICTASFGGSAFSIATGTFPYTLTEGDITLSPLTVTAGLEAAAVTGSSGTTTTMTSTGSVASSTATRRAAGTASAAANSTAAASSLTENVQWALAGALAALAFAA